MSWFGRVRSGMRVRVEPWPDSSASGMSTDGCRAALRCRRPRGPPSSATPARSGPAARDSGRPRAASSRDSTSGPLDRRLWKLRHRVLGHPALAPQGEEGAHQHRPRVGHRAVSCRDPGPRGVHLCVRRLGQVLSQVVVAAQQQGGPVDPIACGVDELLEVVQAVLRTLPGHAHSLVRDDLVDGHALIDARAVGRATCNGSPREIGGRRARTGLQRCAESLFGAYVTGVSCAATSATWSVDSTESPRTVPTSSSARGP